MKHCCETPDSTNRRRKKTIRAKAPAGGLCRIESWLLFVWLAAWLSACLAGWLAAWLAACLPAWLIGCCHMAASQPSHQPSHTFIVICMDLKKKVQNLDHALQYFQYHKFSTFFFCSSPLLASLAGRVAADTLQPVS